MKKVHIHFFQIGKKDTPVLPKPYAMICLFHAEIILHVSLKKLQFRKYKKYYLIVNFYTKPANQAISMNTHSLSNSSYSSYTDLPAMTEYQLPWTYVRSEPKRLP